MRKNKISYFISRNNSDIIIITIIEFKCFDNNESFYEKNSWKFCTYKYVHLDYTFSVSGV